MHFVIVSIGYINRMKVLDVFIDLHNVIVTIAYKYFQIIIFQTCNYCLHDYPFGLGS